MTSAPGTRFVWYQVVAPLGAGEMGEVCRAARDGRILAIREDDSIRSDHVVVVQNWPAGAAAHYGRDPR